VPLAIVHACIGVVGLTASPSVVQPGGNVTVTGKDFVNDIPVVLHLDSVAGPVVYTVAKSTGDVMTSNFSVTFQLPSTVSTGAHVLVATQDEHDMNGGNPARAALYVGTAPGNSNPAARPAAALIDNGPGVGGLTLIALAAMAFALLLFIVFAAVAARRQQPSGTAGA
jgi:hypothetical protein